MPSGAEAASTTKAQSNSPNGKAGDKKIARIQRIEWIVAVLLSAVILFLLIARMTHAGPLDRDESDSLQLARMPRFSDVLENLQYTAFPILFPTTLRTYTTLFGTSDTSLRFFGFAVGLLLLGVVWLYSRKVNREVPLLLPALIGLNASFLTTGGWVRGYGLGSVFVIVAFVLTAKLLLQPSANGLAAVLLAYLASMQLLFFNGVLVAVMAVAGAAAFLANGERRWMWLLLCLAAICGLSYLPYLLIIVFRVSNWAKVIYLSAPFGTEWHQFLSACGGLHVAVSAAWLGVVLIVLFGAMWRLGVVGSAERARERGVLIFGSIVIPVSALAYYAFMRMARNTPHEHHYLALVCLIAAVTDLMVVNFSKCDSVRLVRVVIVAAAICTLPFVVWSRICERQSNIDIVAARLEKDARPNDLIVVNPWWLGISFNHYYHGKNRWITVPEISDHRIHRYDLLQAKMAAFFPLSDVEQEIAAGLKSGNRVWIVGGIRLKQPDGLPTVLAPAPDPEVGWQNNAYTAVWAYQLGHLIRQHAGKLDEVLGKDRSVREWENVWLLAAEGWRY